MKNQDIVFLANRGILAATGHCLDANSGYQFYKFKKALNKAFNEIGDTERELLKEAGIIVAPEEFNARMEALNSKERTPEEDSEMLSMRGKSLTYARLRENLYKENTELPSVTPISYEMWRMLQDENKAVTFGNQTVDVFSGLVEELLEGVLWSIPEE